MKSKSIKDLFGSVALAGMQLKNRMIMAPMTRARAIGAIPNDLMALYYAQRATAGLIITEGTAPSPNGLGYARIPGIFNDEQIEGWKKVTEAVHNDDGKIFVQLMHAGRVTHSANLPAGAEIVSSSAIAASGNMWTDTQGMQAMELPRAMTKADIENTIGEFVSAAINAIKAGFDGVELHAANGYLLEQFLNPNTNVRKDEYGGTIENRSRFVLEIAQAVIKAIGKEKVGVRISPYGTFNDMQVYAEIPATYNYLVNELQQLDIAYLHMIDFAARATTEGQSLIKSIRKHFSNTLILNGGYDKARAEQALQQDEADLISFGSTFISNPDLPYKLANNIPLTPPDAQAFYTADEKGYTDYAVVNLNEILIATK
ncbi:alkene reductase [Mucilaginibacter terrigena]|uniref:Alkene reductase n=1 Tax=Mucilaginibacter terrigena TaxID=2492395 RepID=A0A4Q5LR40_9SPHI|nr:alkene reductase [Mucilaginibacter terrigena]RYU91904.1 alkene reductase [Mucilaginibacter terrigena]